ncbi:helix-turn-helix domain-containing protein, partial [Aeromonas sp. QDB25]
MRYHQLTEGQRYQIACLHDHGLSQAMIARKVGVHPSTISRELRRNRCAQGYQPAEAHQSATLRRCSSSKYRVPEDTLIFVTMALAADWSPEQISSVCRRIGCPVSHEWI